MMVHDRLYVISDCCDHDRHDVVDAVGDAHGVEEDDDDDDDYMMRIVMIHDDQTYSQAD
jgi:hypothetical protein